MEIQKNMAASSQTMKTPTPKPAKTESVKVAPTEKELRLAYSKRGTLILEQVTRQARNLEKLQKSNKASGSEAQMAFLRTGIEALTKRLTAAARNEATVSVGGIPEE